jgi:ubiquinone/menaquinone biosynthesis C-methylase UbiE
MVLNFFIKKYNLLKTFKTFFYFMSALLNYNEIKKIRNSYENKKNIMSLLRKNKSNLTNSPEMILYSYDLQAGSYYACHKNKKNLKIRKQIGEKLTQIILNVKAKSILEAGIGEGNTLAQVCRQKTNNMPTFFGFDISLSRLLYAQKLLYESGKKATLFTGNMTNIPLSDNSVDLVYTSFALEPNHGNEELLMKELFRISRKYVLLIEPSFELGSKITREHIKKHGYVRNLPNVIKKLGHKIIIHELGPFYKKNNQSAIILAEKNTTHKFSKNIKFTSPISGKSIIKNKNFWYCKDDGYIFPVIHQIPCLVKENGILASKIHLFS